MKTAILRNVKLIRTPDNASLSGYCLQAEGYIFSDSRLRFKDGTFVTTSRVQRIEDGCIVTQNSIYEVQ